MIANATRRHQRLEIGSEAGDATTVCALAAIGSDSGPQLITSSRDSNTPERDARSTSTTNSLRVTYLGLYAETQQHPLRSHHSQLMLRLSVSQRPGSSGDRPRAPP